MTHPLLTNPDFDWTDDKAIELHETLTSAFQQIEAAKHLVSTVDGKLGSNIAWERDIATVWREILMKGAKRGLLVRLLERVCATDSVAGYHGFFRALLGDACSDEPGPERSPELSDWEREYLEGRLDKWQLGRSELLAPMSGEPLSRAELYVSLRTTLDVCWWEGEALRLMD